MRRWATAPIAAAVCVICGGGADAHAEPLPKPAADMIAAVADDPEALKAVVLAARKANPDSRAEIDALVASLSREAQAQRAARAERWGFLEGWNGKGEFGASASTGNTVDEGFSIALSLDKETPHWDSDVALALDFKRENDETTKERYFGAYSTRYKITPRTYAVGVLWAERDRFAGFNRRFAESVGLGYRLIERPRLKLRVEAGPALRQSDYLDTGRENTVAARVADYLTWKLNPRLEFTQSLVAYLEDRNSTLLTSAAISTQLQRKFSLRASYEVRHEEDPPLDRENTDTTTRLTVVYSF